MSRQRKTFTQQLKSDFQKNHHLHQQSVDILRKVQTLRREVKALLAPRLDLRFVFAGLTALPRMHIKRVLGITEGYFETQGDYKAARGLFGDASRHLGRWAWFWIGMLFDWIWDEIGHVFFSILYMILTLLGYLLGAWLLLAIIYFVLTH